MHHLLDCLNLHMPGICHDAYPANALKKKIDPKGSIEKYAAKYKMIDGKKARDNRSIENSENHCLREGTIVCIHPNQQRCFGAFS